MVYVVKKTRGATSSGESDVGVLIVVTVFAGVLEDMLVLVRVDSLKVVDVNDVVVV